jgi:16S rRNA (guanine966-N2)-methyltransferase
VTRIVAGVARGRRLRTPAGVNTRPTSELVREALFSALESQLGSLSGVRFLDLYAGSGAVGLEAVSRGAESALLVEHHGATAGIARRNVADLGFAGVSVVTAKVERLTAAPPTSPSFDVAFLDPPYSADNDVVTGVLTGLVQHGWLAAAALLVVERSTRSPGLTWPEGLGDERRRRYGETTLWYGHATGPS